MSKTDKTRPLWVRTRDYSYEVHDHKDGICDIKVNPDGWFGCHISPDFNVAEIRSCCSWCADQEGRKLKARKTRRDGRRQARNWEDEY